MAQADSYVAPSAPHPPGIYDTACACFECLYTRYRGPLVALCLARLRHRQWAEDVAHDAFAKAFTAFPRFDRGRPFWPWLASIAARQCINEQRRQFLAAARTNELAEAPAHAPHDSTARAVLDRMAQAELARQMASLPARQRVALELFALDGWSYADIADRLGCSVGTVKLLLVRARTRLRQARTRLAAALGLHLRNVRDRVPALVERVTARCSWLGEGVGLWGRAPNSVSAVVALVAIVTVPLLPSGGGGAGATGVHAPAGVGQQAWRPPAPALDTGRAAPKGGRGSPPVEPVVQERITGMQRTAHEAAAPLFPPSGGDAGTAFGETFTVSPGYDEDRTVFVVHLDPWPTRRLLVTHDGGASWERRQAVGLASARLLVPPTYPRDDRIFAFWPSLQVSRNGGRTFETLLAGTFDDAVFSPTFGTSDARMLLVQAGNLLSYDVATGAVEPLLLDEALAGHLVQGVAYDRSDPEARTIHLVSRTPVVSPDDPSRGDRYLNTSHVSRCTLPSPSTAARLRVVEASRPAGLTCTTRQPPDYRAAPVGTTPLLVQTEAMLLLRGDWHVFVADHTGQSPASLPFTLGSVVAPRDLVAVPGRPSSAVVARFTLNADEPALLRTDDGGRSWRPLFVDLPGFDFFDRGPGGAVAVAATPTGRLFAIGARFGMACSVDDGRTWAPTCPTPERSAG